MFVQRQDIYSANEFLGVWERGEKSRDLRTDIGRGFKHSSAMTSTTTAQTVKTVLYLSGRIDRTEFY